MINIAIATALCFAAVIWGNAAAQAFSVLFLIATIYQTARRKPKPDEKPAPVKEMTINAIYRLLRGAYYTPATATEKLINRAGLTRQNAESLISIWTRTGEMRRVIYRGVRLVSVELPIIDHRDMVAHVPALMAGQQEGDSRLVTFCGENIAYPFPRNKINIDHDFIFTKEYKDLVDSILF